MLCVTRLGPLFFNPWWHGDETYSRAIIIHLLWCVQSPTNHTRLNHWCTISLIRTRIIMYYQKIIIISPFHLFLLSTKWNFFSCPSSLTYSHLITALINLNLTSCHPHRDPWLHIACFSVTGSSSSQEEISNFHHTLDSFCRCKFNIIFILVCLGHLNSPSRSNFNFLL